MEPHGRYSTRLQSMKDAPASVSAAPGAMHGNENANPTILRKRHIARRPSVNNRPTASRQQLGPNIQSKRALGDITNKAHSQANVLPEKRLYARETKRNQRQRVEKINEREEQEVSCAFKENMVIEKFQKLDPVAHFDMDIDDLPDPVFCAEYVLEIYQHHMCRELHNLPKEEYIRNQSDITEKMRGILMDWLVDVHQKFKLSTETLYLTVYLIDRFLSKTSVIRQRLQLVGVTAMLIAAKYEEIYAPEVGNFVFISNRAYTKEEILKMEALILNEINFDITRPYACTFLQHYLKAARATEKETSLCQFILECSNLDYSTVGNRPSLLAAATCYLVSKMGASFQWNQVLEYHTGFDRALLERAARKLYEIYLKQHNPTNRLTALKRKYSQARFQGVAKTPLCSGLTFDQ